MSRTARSGLAVVLVAVGLLLDACGKSGEPISRTPNDKCMVRACSIYY